MTAGKPLRVLVAAPHEAPVPEGPGWWTQISPLSSIALSAVIIGAAVLLLLKLRRQKRALLGNAATHTDSLGRRREADARAEWIRRTQWALGAAASNNDTRHFYGTTILEALARSDLTGPEDKSILDTVWAESYTRMHDDEIRHLIAECRAAIEQDRDESTPQNRVQLAADRQDERQDPPASGENEATRRSLACNASRADPTNKEQVFATLRREILAARLKVTLDEQLGRATSPTVTRLSKMKLPPIARTRGR